MDYWSFNSFSLLIADLTVTAEVVLKKDKTKCYFEDHGTLNDIENFHKQFFHRLLLNMEAQSNILAFASHRFS